MIKIISEKDTNKLNLKQITFDLKDFDELNKSYVINRIGYLPLIYFNGYPIEYIYIDNFVLYNDSFIPSINIIINNFNMIHRETTIPLDDSVISIFIRSSLKELKDIRLDFKIVDYEQSDSLKPNEAGTRYKFEGILDLNNLYYYYFKSYSNKSSFDVLKEIANESGLGFATNISGTKDNMTWRNPGKNNIDFINYITNHAYSGDDTFYWSFIDLYYNLNFVDIEKQIREDLENFKGITDAMQNSQHDFPMIQQKLSNNIILLSNEEEYKNSDGHFYKYEIINQSTIINIKNAYIREVSYYDIRGNKNEGAGHMINFFTDSFITPESEKDKIILKGRLGDNRFYNNHISRSWAGFIDQSNAHKNYLYAHMQNKSNILDIQKIYIKLRLTKPNFNLYRFCKVLIYAVTSPLSPNESYPNKFLNGDWLITGINMIYEDQKLIQELILIKREINSL